MADYFDNDTLITNGQGKVLLNLVCGYGQPVATTVYLKESGGATKEIAAFSGDVSEMELGDVADLRTNRISIFSTIHDIRDINPGEEVQDILLDIKVMGGGAVADTSFIKKTKGKGSLVKCTYEVIVI